MIPYEVLGIRPNATLEEAEAAYRQRIVRCHPDTLGDADEQARRQAEERTRELNDAIAAVRSRRVAAGRVHDPWDFATPDAGEAATTCPVCGEMVASRWELQAHAYESHGVGRPGRTPRGEPNRFLQPTAVWLMVTIGLFVLYGALSLCVGVSCASGPSLPTQVVVGAIFLWLVVVPVLYWHFTD